MPWPLGLHMLPPADAPELGLTLPSAFCASLALRELRTLRSTRYSSSVKSALGFPTTITPTQPARDARTHCSCRCSRLSANTTRMRPPNTSSTCRRAHTHTYFLACLSESGYKLRTSCIGVATRQDMARAYASKDKPQNAPELFAFRLWWAAGWECAAVFFSGAPVPLTRRCTPLARRFFYFLR